MNEPLSEREIEILRLVAAGCANGEIAAQLSLSLNTIKWYSKRIYEKLAVENRTQAIKRAQSLGLLTAPHQTPKATPPLNNLPSPLTTFVGRRSEIDTVKQLLKQHRLLTLTGPGGIGKTRLALQVATEMSGIFPDGVCFVDLAPLTEDAMVINTIAQRLGIAEAQNIPLLTLIQAALRDKHFLLILDNFEHLLATAPLVADLLAAAHALTVLVTSREVLALYGEQEYAVPPLKLPDLEWFAANHLSPNQLLTSEALQLFERCAQAVAPEFRLTPENTTAVASLCLRLDGLPLAIELAAAYSKLLTPQAMLTQLDSLWLEMKHKARNIPARQQTLRNTVEWSYGFLNEEERRLFAQLAVLRGGCTLDAVAAICDHRSKVVLLQQITGLVNKSLLWRRTDEQGEPRFGMLTTIREYALSCLEARGEVATLRQRHAQYFAQVVQQLGERLYGAESKRTLEQLDQIADDVTGAWHWLLERVETGADQLHTAHWLAQLIPTLAEKYYIQARLQEGQQRFLQAAALLQKAGWGVPQLIPAQPVPTQTVFAQLQVRLGLLNYDLGQYEAVLQQIGAVLPSLQAWGNGEELALALQMLGKANYRRGDRTAAHTQLQQSFAYAQAAAYHLGWAAALNNLSHLAEDDGDYAKCERLLGDCLAIYKEMNYAVGIGTTLGNLGHVYGLAGNHEQALHYSQQALAIAEQEGDPVSKVVTLCQMADAQRALGDQGAAVRNYQQSLALAQQLSYPHGVIVSLNGLAQSYLDLCDLPSATHCLVEVLSIASRSAGITPTLIMLRLLAEVWAQQRQPEPALRVLAFVVQHPSATVWVRQAAQQRLTELAQTVPPTLVDHAQQWAAAQPLAAALDWVQAEYIRLTTTRWLTLPSIP